MEMRYVIDDPKYGQRTEFDSLDEIRAAAESLADDWGCDVNDTLSEMIESAKIVGREGDGI